MTARTRDPYNLEGVPVIFHSLQRCCPHGKMSQPMPSSELFSGPNAGYVEELFQRYLADPDSVSAHWGSVFAKEATARGLSPTAAPEPA
ncbi:MAG: hypothetical protein F4Y48_07965, partial [Gammaproteobacteria bacterium]|nr:hypothetical protein [Gammaproteobacteria bacterium]